MKGYIPEQTRLTQVHLRTARLTPLLRFYSDVLGLHASDGAGAHASLSAAPQKPALVRLSEDAQAAPRRPRSLGLYHFALRYPTRAGLGRAYQRIVEAGYPITGASDHGVSEAIYLADPEGNGIELYADRPRSEWLTHNGQIEMVTRALALDELLATATARFESPETAQPELGHIHLHVADLPVAERFYGDFLGLNVTQRSYSGALFFAAGDYHHHIGVNIWAGKAAPASNSVGLVSYRVEVPISEILYCLNHRAPLLGYETRTVNGENEPLPLVQIRDPNGTWLEVKAASEGIADSGAGCTRHAERARKLCGQMA